MICNRWATLLSLGINIHFEHPKRHRRHLGLGQLISLPLESSPHILTQPISSHSSHGPLPCSPPYTPPSRSQARYRKPQQSRMPISPFPVPSSSLRISSSLPFQPLNIDFLRSHTRTSERRTAQLTRRHRGAFYSLRVCVRMRAARTRRSRNVEFLKGLEFLLGEIA